MTEIIVTDFMGRQWAQTPLGDWVCITNEALPRISGNTLSATFLETLARQTRQLQYVTSQRDTLALDILRDRATQHTVALVLHDDPRLQTLREAACRS